MGTGVSESSRTRRFVLALLLMLLVLVGGPVAAARATTFNVNPAIADAADPAPNPAHCATSTTCSLRQVIQDANADTGNADTIDIGTGTYTLTRFPRRAGTTVPPGTWT